MPEETMKIDKNITISGNNNPNLIELSKAAKIKTGTEKEFLQNEIAILQFSAQIQRNSEPIDFEGFPDPQINHHKTGKVDWKRFELFKHFLRVYAKVYRGIEIWRKSKSTLNKVEKGRTNPLTALHFRKAK